MLEREGLMEKKGFPESYDLPALLRFLNDVKAGRRPVRAPVYSHLVYDIMASEWVEIDRPDILIVEGLNVLQTGRPPKDGKAIPYVSDFFDFSVYLDAAEDVLLEWYVDRFLTLRGTAFRDPKSYFHRYSKLNDEEAVTTARRDHHRVDDRGDFSVDREQWVTTPGESQIHTTWSLGSFYIGEERVTADLVPFVAETGELRSRLVAKLTEARIQTSVHYPAMHRFSAYEREGPASLPVAESIADRVMTLPLHPNLSEADVDEICSLIADTGSTVS